MYSYMLMNLYISWGRWFRSQLMWSLWQK